MEPGASSSEALPITHLVAVLHAKLASQATARPDVRSHSMCNLMHYPVRKERAAFCSPSVGTCSLERLQGHSNIAFTRPIAQSHVDIVQQVWWNCDVIIIGEGGLKKNHQVLRFLQEEGRVASLGYFRHGVDAFEQAYPYLVGQSLKAHRDLVYPSPVREVEGLYLGNWKNAEDKEKLKQLGVTRLVTIHNEPQALKFPGVCSQDRCTFTFNCHI